MRKPPWKKRRGTSPSSSPPRNPHSEPWTEGDEWVDHGGQLIWAAGFTPGGAPYGVTLNEFQECNKATAGGADWARAKQLLRELFEHWPELPRAELDFGRVTHVGDGISRRAFAADVGLDPDPARLSGIYVVLLPRRDAEPSYDDRARFEARLLWRLSELDLPLQIPRCVGLLPSAGRPAVIETFIEGVPLDLRAGRQPSLRPWEVVAQVAAAVHALDAKA